MTLQVPTEDFTITCLMNIKMIQERKEHNFVAKHKVQAARISKGLKELQLRPSKFGK